MHGTRARFFKYLVVDQYISLFACSLSAVYTILCLSIAFTNPSNLEKPVDREVNERSK